MYGLGAGSGSGDVAGEGLTVVAVVGAGPRLSVWHSSLEKGRQHTGIHGSGANVSLLG